MKCVIILEMQSKLQRDNVYLSYTLHCFFIASCLYWLENVKEDFVL